MAAMEPKQTVPNTVVDCILESDGTPESKEAERLLREAGISFHVFPPGHTGRNILILQTRFGNLTGIDGVRAYVARFGEQ